jgi:hypothetical protein
MASATRSGSSVRIDFANHFGEDVGRERRLRSALCNGRSRLARSTLVDGDGDRRLAGRHTRARWTAEAGLRNAGSL